MAPFRFINPSITDASDGCRVDVSTITTSPFLRDPHEATQAVVIKMTLQTGNLSIIQDVLVQVGHQLLIPTTNFAGTCSPTSFVVTDCSFGQDDSYGVININAATACFAYPQLSPAEARHMEMRSRIRSQLACKFNTKHLNIVKETTPEAKARGLLREMIGDKAFLQYVKKGFITVRGRTGLMYKVSPSGIWSYAPKPDGKYDHFEYICIVFKQHGIPPTDAVIMRKLLIEHDEFGLRKAANVSKRNSSSIFRQEAVAVAAG